MSIGRNHAIAAIVLGGIELAMGVTVSIAALVTTGKSNLNFFLTPYLGGFFLITPGILGFVTGFTKNRCCMQVFMLLNIVCLFAEVALLMPLIAFYDLFWKSASSTYCWYSKVKSTCTCISYAPVEGIESCDVLSTTFPILTLVIVFLITAVIIALSACILGCAVVCCSSVKPPTDNGSTAMVPTYLQFVTANTLPENVI
nr:uncharacterized protein LOC101236146 [Hydra vulgaris]